jgi:hypothetical protein
MMDAVLDSASAAICCPRHVPASTSVLSKQTRTRHVACTYGLSIHKLSKRTSAVNRWSRGKWLALCRTQNLLGCTAVFLTECRRFRGTCCLHHKGVMAARTCKTSVDIELRTRQYIPEDSELHTRRRGNLKSQNFLVSSEGPVYQLPFPRLVVFLSPSW